MKPSSRKCLREMDRQERLENFAAAEIVCQGTRCYRADQRLYWHTVKELIELGAIVNISDESVVKRYILGAVGKAMVRRPDLMSEIRKAVDDDLTWTLKNDHVVLA